MEKNRTKKSNIKVDANFRKKLILFTLLFALAAILIVSVCVVSYSVSTMPIDFNAIKLNFSSVIYALDKDGNPVEYTQVHGEENRLWADFEDIPQNLKDAFVAIEDERFYKHIGVDIPRTVKATFNYIINKDSSFGGSTINQQLVKNLTGEGEKLVERKVTEIIRAIYMDSQLTKDQILELYMNTIYLSQGCNGVKTASEKYFGKDVSDLTLAECASIAGITQYPTQYDPILNPENNKKKQELVLNKMLELGMITDEEYSQAVNEKLNIQNNNVTNTSYQSTFTDYLLEQVILDLQDKLGVNESVATGMVYNGGLQIYTTLRADVQSAIDNVYDNPKKYLPAYNPDDPVQSAIVVLDPGTGEIVGMRGELGEKTQAFTLNRATAAPRQPGSSIKPLAVYAPGFEYQKFTSGSVFVDGPHTVNGHTFHNADGSYRGAVSVKTAIASSLNTVSVKALEKVGIDNSYQFLTKNLHFTTISENDKALSPLACGGLTNGVTVLEMTAAYSTFANKGIYIKPYCYTKITDINEKTILENKKQSSVAMSEETSYTMLNCLKGVVTSGTGIGAQFSNNYYIGGKTGSTDDYKDRWFMGITPYYVGGVWFGYDYPKSISGYGGNPALTLWTQVMKEIHKGLPAKQFESPHGVSSVSICSRSGKRATELCSQNYGGSTVIVEQMDISSAPSSYCTLHQSVTVDKESGMIASPSCPAELLEERVLEVVPGKTLTCLAHGDGKPYGNEGNDVHNEDTQSVPTDNPASTDTPQQPPTVNSPENHDEESGTSSMTVRR